MNSEERIVQLENRLAGAEARIATLEARPWFDLSYPQRIEYFNQFDDKTKIALAAQQATYSSQGLSSQKVNNG